MIVQMAGLPGTGKSTLAAALARVLSAVVLDKDRVRHALFTTAVSYTREQNDFCVDILLRTAEYLLRHEPTAIIIMDGRTCLRAYQVEQVRSFALGLGQPLCLVECVCAEATARDRLAHDHTHPAANRDFALYQRIRDLAEPIPEPKLIVCTDDEPDAVLGYCLTHLRGMAAPPATGRWLPGHAP